MSIAAGPVAAVTGSNGCVVASSFVSVATFASRNPGASVACTNQTVEFWRRRIQAGLEVQGTVEEVLGATSSSFNKHQIRDVLLEPTAHAGEFAVLQHLLSLTLSLQSGVSAPGAMNVSYVQGVWRSYMLNQPTYIAPTGLRMTEEQLLGWLRALMGYAIR